MQTAADNTVKTKDKNKRKFQEISWNFIIFLQFYYFLEFYHFLHILFMKEATATDTIVSRPMTPHRISQ